MTTDEMFDVLLETLGAEDFLNELVKALSSDELRVYRAYAGYRAG